MKCSSCSAEIEDGSKYCFYCGAEQKNDYKECVKCQTRLEKDARFCPSCGTEQPFSYKVCVRCGAKIESGATFCIHCGTQQVAPVSYKYCPSCGKAIPSNQVRCDNCGAEVVDHFLDSNNPVNTFNKANQPIPAIVNSLRSALLGTAILWIIVGSVQILYSLYAIVVLSPYLFNSAAANYGFDSFSAVSGIIVLLLFGILNIVVAVKDINGASKLKRDFTGITKKFSFYGEVVTYLWNGYIIGRFFFKNFPNKINFVFVFISICVIAAMLVDFIGIRVFVKKNTEKFAALDSAAA